MGEMQLEHRMHDIEWSQVNSAIGRFVSAYCNDCDEYLGTLNIGLILDHMELDD